MPIPATYLLDTGILLHWVRGSKVATVIDGQFQLRSANFRPLICEVSLGEIEAFARSQKWGEAKRTKLKELTHPVLLEPALHRRARRKWSKSLTS